MTNIKCILGFHNWVYLRNATYYPNTKIVDKQSLRVCLCCGTVELLDQYWTGKNNNYFVEEWYQYAPKCLK